MNKEKELNYYIKFYADTLNEKNKYFCFKIKSILELKNAIMRFYDKGFNLRAVYYSELNTTTGEFSNERIPQETLNQIFEEFISKHKKLSY